MSNTKLAAPELASIEVQGMTREAFIARSTIAAASVYGLATVGPFVSEALAQGGTTDLDIANYALTLEFLEAAFYEQAVKNGGAYSGPVKELATTLRDNELEHVDALTQTIRDAGGKPVKAPEVAFGNAFANEKSFLKTAQTFEDLGVGAYNGAGPQIKDKKILAAAGAIVQIEGRHAGAIRFLNGQKIAPSPFDKGLEMEDVLKAAKPFIKS